MKARNVFMAMFSREGYEELLSLVAEAEKRLRDNLKDKGEAGRGQDTWHDEGFKAGTVREMLLSKRLAELRSLVRIANVIDPEEQKDSVQFGSGVVIEYEDGSKKQFVVDGYQVGRAAGRISIHSPLAKALLGARVGDKRNFRVENNEKTVCVKQILPPSLAKTLIG